MTDRQMEQILEQLRAIELAVKRLDGTMRTVVGLTMTRSRGHDGPPDRLDRIEHRLALLERRAELQGEVSHYDPPPRAR